jgi:hypothetical protein
MSDNGWNQSGYEKSIKVQAKKLGNVIDETIIKKIRLAKIDVEGAEEQVVNGMLDVLQINSFDVWCEVRGENSDRNPGSYKAVIRLLEPLGYKPYCYDGKELREFMSNDIQQVFDIVFKCKK